MAAVLDSATPDVRLRLDGDGIIREVAVAAAYAGEGAEAWVGLPWTETVREFGGTEVRRLMDDARAHGVSGFRQVTQRFPSGLELPVDYTTVRIGGTAGLVAIGKNAQMVTELQSRLVAAQLAMERDYWKLRDVESRYRLLFDASNDAVLLLRPANLEIAEANTAAIRALGTAPVGRNFLAEIPPEERAAFQSMLTAVRENGRAPGVVAHLGPARESWAVRGSLMAGEAGPLFLLQLTRAGAARAAAGVSSPVPWDELIERVPDGMILADPQGGILRANRAFAELVEVNAESGLAGERIQRWLSLPGADWDVLTAGVQRNGAVRLFPASLTDEVGASIPVEISAAADDPTAPRLYALVIRDVGNRAVKLSEPDPLRAALDTTAGKIGQAPLQDLVRTATELVERHAIETALRVSGNNRTAAAELLGLSRQSLYVKLNRYGRETGDDGI